MAYNNGFPVGYQQMYYPQQFQAIQPNYVQQAQRDNVGLQNQLNMANLAASQNAQNALIQQGFANEVDALYNRLNSCPVPSTPVFGRTPIFTCGGQNMGCGCGAVA